MKLLALEVFFKDPATTKVTQLYAAHDLSTFSFFQRSSAKEFMNFTSKIIAERTSMGSRASVKEQEYVCHVYVQSDGLSAVVIGDHEYPQRVAHSFINKVLDEFTQLNPPTKWKSAPAGGLQFPNGETLLANYQNPRESDALSRVQADVDETKVILHQTLEAMLNRGEKLDDLVRTSDNLSAQSKAFYTTARKANSCSCVIL
ncbi:synaptobrevin homolog YKT6-like [Watersipora subatra]|uniref:synaptobrevin homolog YKT6-like n=1 Tax=Watersipora subatra TaxID=2589382 RepID=UPI00355B0664